MKGKKKILNDRPNSQGLTLGSILLFPREITFEADCVVGRYLLQVILKMMKMEILLNILSDSFFFSPCLFGMTQNDYPLWKGKDSRYMIISNIVLSRWTWNKGLWKLIHSLECGKKKMLKVGFLKMKVDLRLRPWIRDWKLYFFVVLSCDSTHSGQFVWIWIKNWLLLSICDCLWSQNQTNGVTDHCFQYTTWGGWVFSIS